MSENFTTLSTSQVALTDHASGVPSGDKEMSADVSLSSVHISPPHVKSRVIQDDVGQVDLVNAYIEWIENFAPWRSMITLTVSNEHTCSRIVFIKRVRSLVQVLNRDLFGKHFFRICGHSYFSHILGIEFTTLGAIHGHMLVDQPINYELVHRFWNSVSGFAFIKPVDDLSAAARYVTKYVVKHQDLEMIYRSRNFKRPAFSPSWYTDNL